MRIALVHEFLTQLGGAERVLENFLEIWPNAMVHVLIYDEKKTHGKFEQYQKRLSFLNNWPLARTHYKLLLPFMTQAIESFKFDDFDLVISDSSAFAKGIKTDKLHICYCHTPTRYLWTEAKSYLKAMPYPFFLKWAGSSVLPYLRRWDYKAAQRVNFFVANSENVRKRIGKYYQRDSVVIPPPVDNEFFRPVSEKKDYFFTASRLEPYKKMEIVVGAFNVSGLKLKIAGTGSKLAALKKLAKSNIEFLGRISDDELRRRYSEAQAFIFPAEEDAGIMILEANACGTPVIAYRAGGALESVIEGKTGEFFKEQSVEAIKTVVRNFDAKKYNAETIRQQAQQYDKKIFQKKIKEFVEEKYAHRT
ncbi:MAG: hypothetical protein A3B10_02205 [Candidatus Doudnabacteria bacterium RIFCSPLOWO2_01_FULL_44_21]|uniref:Uncharacterized protein n=1 Tax=Candidatus Doudnabacteria bacterium RIFCSPLOWO2_01_FULL_44_21 TaxID=1817841 RepID=A0A1F5Q595_9BACT|nr:MAG: hypothetical protein A3B95_01095 [Candidatus Doudnabacteria bacterium RIFCSPHIGHO2_02_FULL_43_13b]OGE97385.1 MAG: hypothetical protein A3B10_02205 [Candidatus Doudnabacteria bacterium RIFCSPLOWO2_01_FULL_44_21]